MAKGGNVCIVEALTARHFQRRSVMNMKLIAMCGDYCGVCSFREETNCPTCQIARGDMFCRANKDRICQELS